MPVLDIHGLSIDITTRDQLVHAVRDVSLTVDSGEIVGLVGESGGGKSMLSMAIPGLLPAAAKVISGSIKVDGVEALGLDEAGRRGLRRDLVGVVFQHPMRALNPRLTIRAQIVEALTASDGLDRDARALELLDRVGIDRASERLLQYPHELSGGLAQRVVIGLALARNPRLMIADEPTTALDVNVQAQILDLIDQLRRDLSLSVLLVSHDLDVISDRADRVAVMQAGSIVETGPVERVVDAPSHAYTAKLLAARPAIRLARRLSTDPVSPVDGAPILEGIDISRTFGPQTPIWGDWHTRRPAVRNVSIAVHAGESVGIVGESGSGKTSLARILVGLERADQGEVRFRGAPVARLNAADRQSYRREAQFVFQDSTSSLNPRLTVGESIGEPLLVEGVPRAQREARVLSLLDEVGLDRGFVHRKPSQLSGGQRQRVNIARALVRNPSLIIADEPVSALDVSVQATVLALLLDLQKQRNMASIIISHDLSVIGLLCQTVVVMYRGEVVEQGPVASVLGNPGHAYTRELVNAIPGRRRSGKPASPSPSELFHAL